MKTRNKVECQGHDPVSSKQGYYPWLDALRFIAAFAVVICHARYALFVDYASLLNDSRNNYTILFYAVTRLGHEAVIIFFVLSGYLVGGRAIMRINDGSFKPREFAIDRLVRIWLPLIPAIALTELITGTPDSTMTIAGNLFGLQGTVVPVLAYNHPLWSLAYEIWFYVLAYAIGRIFCNNSMDYIGLMLIIIIALIFTVLKTHYLVCWVIGAIFYVKHDNYQSLLSVVASILLILFPVAGLQLSGGGIFRTIDGSSLVIAGFELLLSVATANICAKLISVRPPRLIKNTSYLAAFSYTLYLTHIPVISGFVGAFGLKPRDRVDLGAFLLYSVLIIFCLLVAYVLYYCFERHTNKLKKIIKTRF